MDERDFLAQRFEEHRPRLRAVAHRILGSTSEADDAIQEAWLRLTRSDADTVENLGGWLTTVVARICLNMLRTRTRRGEEPLPAYGPLDGVRRISYDALSPGGLGGHGHDATAGRGYDGTDALGCGGVGQSAYGGVGEDPEAETVLADSVGLALVVVLEALNPAERLAFVLHDMFSVPFDEIAPIVGRTPTATRQLASRARRRVCGAVPEGERVGGREREVVEAFLSAARGGDLDALVAVLDPDVVIGTADGTRHTGRELGGARVVARGAMSFLRSAESVDVALVDGTIGAVATTAGHRISVATFSITGNRITTLDIITAPDHLATLTITPLPA